MEVKDIIESYLKAHGYDGLYNVDVECACPIGDLQPCDGIQNGCAAGYYQHHTAEQIAAGESGECDDAASCECIGAKKPAPKETR